MPAIKLDGKEIPFEKGESIIRAAQKAGVEIPHYCWHAGLSVAANCRMCLVEIDPMAGRRAMSLDIVRWDADKQAYVNDRKPKLEPACQAECMDGMVIRSDSSPHVAEARKSVQEFLLLNHPVDCPICDQAGECKLQDYWLSEQHAPKRMRDEPIHKPKAVPFGSNIVYDAERCIVCTRCVRFMEEVAKDPVLEKRERGNLGEIILAEGRQLEGHYTMMVDHVCPVGALTTVDFRFKARVWFLRTTNTICPGCATGCNATLDFDSRTGEVPRLRPRDNEAVNKFWMCDDGILTHRRVQEDRILRAYVGKGEARKETTPLDALKQAAALIKRGSLAVVLSAQRSTEDNAVLAHLATTYLGISDFYLARLGDWDGDDILRDVDQNPNVRGATKAAGGTIHSLGDLAKKIDSGAVDTVLALGGHADVDESIGAAFARTRSIVIAANHSALSDSAEVLLPAASWAESEGSFINRQGLEQRFDAGPAPAGDSRHVFEIISRLAKQLGHPMTLTRLNDVRTLVAASSPAQANLAPAE